MKQEQRPILLKVYFCISIAILLSSLLFGQKTDHLLTAVFPKNILASLDTSGFHFTKTYTPTTSTWAISDIFPESIVFQSELSYESSKTPENSYQLRIGKGGQIYSFRGPFGESVPPQWRSARGDTSRIAVAKAPWIDEVWQMVAVDNKKNNRDVAKYFIHQAGVYLKTSEQDQPFYSPLLAEYFDEDRQSYSVINWGQQAHTDDNLKADFRSDLLYYTTYTNLGKGIIQVDAMIYNFGDDIINHINMPWGGVRVSSLKYFFESTPNHEYIQKEKRYGTPPLGRTTATGGWLAYSGDIEGKGPAMAIVVSKEEEVGGNLFRYGFAGAKINNNPRDYNVFAITRKLKSNPVSFGKAIQFRYYYVVGASVEAVKNTILANSLTTQTREGFYSVSKKKADDVYYHFRRNYKAVESMTVTENAENALHLKAQPYKNSYPLFWIQGCNGAEVITSDQYHFSKLPYDGKMKAIKLLGFLDERVELTGLKADGSFKVSVLK